MKIQNIAKNEAYELPEGAKIEVERTNPFMNEYGESTTPLDIPASEKNRRLLDYPDMFGRIDKMQAIDVSIQDGEFFTQCRQVVLSAQHNGNISSSFYLNDGSFYSKIQSVKLKSLFKDRFVESLNTVEDCIQFCRSLRSGSNDKYAIFPVLLTDDSGIDSGWNFKILNAYGKMRDSGTKTVWKFIDGQYQEVSVPSFSAFYPNDSSADSDFYNAVQRTEYVNSIPITIKPGYYISPFIKVSYLLKEIFKYYGYTLQDNFFTTTEPFKDMVIINNVIDVMVNGHIRMEDLLPDVTVTDFLSVIRKKFCCEFVSDEGQHTANIIFLRDVVNGKAYTDLTHSMTEEPTLSYKAEKDYKRIVLTSKTQVDSEAQDSFDDFADMLAKNPTAYFNNVDGCFYKDGYSGNYLVITKIGECSQSYNTGEDTEEQQVEIPECIPEFRQLFISVAVDDDTTVKYDFGKYLYIGKYNTLNSSMVVAGKDEETNTDDANVLPTMLAFAYNSGNLPVGTISCYDIYATGTPRIFDYALYYAGEFGIYEKFYRDYDLLLRNALQELKVKLLLSQSQKMNIPAYAKVVIRGVAFFMNKLKFTLGGKSEPSESEFVTIGLSTPIKVAKKMTEFFPMMACEYEWYGCETRVQVSEDDYNNSGLDKDRTFTTIYPPIPSASQVGQKYGIQKSYTSEKIRHASFWRHSIWTYTLTTVWLECRKKA